MHIRRLELLGFKSFVSRTRFEFHDGITGIVGPNGCGKSNLVDAIRWVLGEQSPSHLRGHAMEDVIFNGNDRTGPLGMAEVSLVLERTDTGPLWGPVHESDDPDTDLQRQLAGVSELTITRRYFRSGESEYLINRVPCRLRDITELFLGSGVGTKAYAIIEQGRVDQLVNAKPDALRLFIEEAAGTTRYRSRRIVAERKLERTRDHLTRLSDIIREIERQTSSLTRQARRAEEYRKCRDELRDIELRVACRRYRGLAQEIGEAESRLGPLAQRESELLRELHDAERAATDAHAAVRAADEDQRESQVRIVRLGHEAQAAAQRIGFIEETLGDSRRRREQTDLECQQLEAELERASAEGALAAEMVARLEREAQEGAGRRAALERAFDEHHGEVAEAEGLLEAGKGEAVTALAQEVQLQNLVGALARRREEIEERLSRAQERLERSEQAVEQNLVQLEATRRRASGLQAEADEIEASCREQAAARDEARRGEAAAARDLEVAREQVATQGSRLRSLEELRTRWEGCARGVRHVVEQAPSGVLGVVADILTVPKAYEAAVAAALGPRLQCVIVRDHGESVRALEVLAGMDGGRASFIPLSPRPEGSRAESGGQSLLDVVEAPEEYRALTSSLLANVRVVDSVRDAIALWQRNGTRGLTVTKNGELIDDLGVLSGGSDRPLEEILLVRNREVRELRTVVAAATAAADAAAQFHQEAAQRVERLQRVHEAVAGRLQGIRVEHARSLKDEERLAEEHNRLVVEHEAAELDRRALREEHAHATDELAGLRRRLDEAMANKVRRESVLAEQQALLADSRAKADAARAALNDLAVEDARRRERQNGAEETVRRAAESADGCGRRLNDLRWRAGQIDEDMARLRTERSALEQRRDEWLTELGAAEAEAASSASRATAAAADAAQREEVARERRDALEWCREERRSIEVALAELRAAVEHLVAAVKEKAGEDLTQRDAGEAEDDVPGDTEASQRIEQLRARLAQLGEVHGGAIEELDELRRRHEYLSRQRDDLQRSVDDLRRTIAKLNRLSRTRFRETFDEANVKLGEIFPRLFAGGRAQLVLTQPEDGSEPGVEIVVQPVGKKLGSLSLLSGGEKALTAVALILSLFMIRPTPFCVLDEVDAPLDDANVGRFDQLIREISRTSQFVLITHNKRTMEAADTLYGVTMEQAGVSKVVSVRLEQAA